MADARTMTVDRSAALAAALLLGIQTLLMSMSLGVHAGLGRPDAFGGPLCVSLHGAGNAGQTPGGGHSLPDCCSFGCALASGSPLPASASALPLPGMSARVAYLLPDFPLQARTDRSSIRARGPPSLA
jgi:hypothetical protein